MHRSVTDRTQKRFEVERRSSMSTPRARDLTSSTPMWKSLVILGLCWYGTELLDANRYSRNNQRREHPPIWASLQRTPRRIFASAPHALSPHPHFSWRSKMTSTTRDAKSHLHTSPQLFLVQTIIRTVLSETTGEGGEGRKEIRATKEEAIQFCLTRKKQEAGT